MFFIKLYEFAQPNYAALPTMSKDELIRATEYVEAFLKETEESAYYALLNSDNRYFTIFIKESKDEDAFYRLAKEAIECAESLGEVKAIEKNELGALEFWIVPRGKDLAYVYLLFDYSQGIIIV